MYLALHGRITLRQADRMGLLVQGKEYEIFTPLNSVFARSSKSDVVDNEDATVYIYRFRRDDNEKLFGFSSLDDRDLFIFLLQIKGVGVQLALSILSHLNRRQLEEICQARNVGRLQKIPRIGKMTAESLIFELTRHQKKWQKGSIFNEEQNKAMQVLKNLGYTEKEILSFFRVHEQGESEPESTNAEYWIKHVLRQI